MNLADMDLLEIPRAIYSLSEAPNLVALDLSYNEDVKSVVGVEKLVNLKNLDLEGCGLTDIDPVFQLSGLVRNARDEISMWRDVTTDEGVESLK